MFVVQPKRRTHRKVAMHFWKHKFLNYLFAVLGLFIFLSCARSGNREAGSVTPQLKEGRYIFNLQNQTLEIDPRVGGRITSLRIADKEFLTGRDVHPTNWGSTFWPSPQSAWKWPPSATLDTMPYVASVQNNVLKLVSQQDPKLGYVFTKEISADTKRLSFKIKYTITNQSTQTQQVAPWEISRVFPKGLTFYPTGTGEPSGPLALFTEKKAGITWFDYQDSKIPAQDLKLFADGAEGWLAQVHAGILLVKQFPEVPANKAAPAEAEIEIYSAKRKNYIEIEQQGSYSELAPGASTTWEVTWYLRQLPATIKAEPGNSELAAYVRKLVN